MLISACKSDSCDCVCVCVLGSGNPAGKSGNCEGFIQFHIIIFNTYSSEQPFDCHMIKQLDNTSRKRLFMISLPPKVICVCDSIQKHPGEHKRVEFGIPRLLFMFWSKKNANYLTFKKPLTSFNCSF